MRCENVVLAKVAAVLKPVILHVAGMVRVATLSVCSKPVSEIVVTREWPQGSSCTDARTRDLSRPCIPGLGRHPAQHEYLDEESSA